MKNAMAALVLAFLWSFCSVGVAAPLFTARVNVQDDQRTFTFSSLPDVFDQLETGRLEAAIPAYTDMSMASADIDFIGLPMNFAFPDSSSTLRFSVPRLGISEEFMGLDRDASLKLLEDFLKKDGGDILNRLQAALIATSPVNPIAGNPASLMGGQVSGQFSAGFSDQTTNVDTGSSGEAPPQGGADDLIPIGSRFGRYTAGGRNSNVWTLPLGYSFRFKERGKGLRKISLSLPITYADIEGGKSGKISIDGGFSYAITERWILSPAVGAGLTGSVDLGTAGGVGSYSLTSAYTLPLRKFSVNIGNMFGYYHTLDIKVGDYRFDPGVSNTALRNGVMFSIPSKLGKRKVVTELWVIDTRFFGDDLYSERYDEIGFTFGLPKTKGFSIENFLRAGASYLTGDGVEGWRFNLNYEF